MNPPSNVHRLPNRDAALKSLYDDLSAKSMFPFWAQKSDVTNDEIKQLMGGKKAVPYVWRCEEDIEPILNRAVELITMEDSERLLLEDRALVQATLKCSQATDEALTAAGLRTQ